MPDEVDCPEIVLRSLRRMLCQAFRNEDKENALRIYTASLDDWEVWRKDAELKRREAFEKRQQQRQQQALGRWSFRSCLKSEDVPLDTTTIVAPSYPSPLGKSSATKLSRRQRREQPGLLHLKFNPSDPFEPDDLLSPSAPYVDYSADTNLQIEPHQRKMDAFKRFWRSKKTDRWSDNGSSSRHKKTSESHMITPLHEAARLGHAELIRLMLQHPGVDPNLRNGEGQTALHCVAGGVTIVDESNRHQSKDEFVGIGPWNGFQKRNDTLPELAEGYSASFRQSRRSVASNMPMSKSRSGPSVATSRSHKDLEMERTDAALALLSWCHADDGTTMAGQGLSINAVDEQGRTALHYSAELGRSEISSAIASVFGAILNIVDNRGKTPCELAAGEMHSDLAAHLEARAVLYVDHDAVDDDAVALVQFNSEVLGRGRLVPPFSWFESLPMVAVQTEREQRVNFTEDTLKEMVRIELDTVANRNALHAWIDRKNAGNESEGLQPSSDVVQSDEVESTVTKPPSSSKPSSSDPPLELRLARFQAMHKSHVMLYLASHDWNVQRAQAAFRKSPFAAFDEAHVPIPCDVDNLPKEARLEGQECLICCETCESSDLWVTLSSCGHSFCKECLGEYIANCAASKSGLTISCPHHDCKAPLSPYEVVTLCPTVEVYERLLDSENESFVVKASEFRFCPHPSCGAVVKFHLPQYVKNAGLDPSLLHSVGAVCATQHPIYNERKRLTYEGVYDPNFTNSRSLATVGKAHRFCFACGDRGRHWPAPCDRLGEWKDVMRLYVQEVQELGHGDGEDNYTEIAQKLWLKTNTRPCPKCKAPIEKNEGCNHMICSNPHCNFEFCWICRNDWKLHNTQTGGFFRCNRWIDQKEHEYYDTPPENPTAIAAQLEDIADPTTMEATYGTAMHAARVARKKAREVSRFLHHYERWNAHAESATMELRMSDSVGSRLLPVVQAAAALEGDPSFNFGGDGWSFVHDAFSELLECRSMLQHSYAQSYFRYNMSTIKKLRHMKQRLAEKGAFEQLQSELEMLTEQMSDVVARSHLRASKSQIQFLTAMAAEKRKEFSNIMISIHVAEKKDVEEKSTALEVLSNGGLQRSTRNQSGNSRYSESTGEISESQPPVDLRSSSPYHSAGDADEEGDDDDHRIEEAIRASLQDFMDTTSPHNSLPTEPPTSDNELPDEWSCVACTYINAGGGLCAMCGTDRSDLNYENYA